MTVGHDKHDISAQYHSIDQDQGPPTPIKGCCQVRDVAKGCCQGMYTWDAAKGCCDIYQNKVLAARIFGSPSYQDSWYVAAYVLN